MSDIDAKAVRKLADILNEKNLDEIEYEADEKRIRVVRHKYQAATTAQVHAPIVTPMVGPAALQAVQPPQEEGEIIKSPMVGTVYLSPEPGAPTFIKVGDTIKKDQVLMIIEAMKVMNPLKAPFGGVVKKILISDSKPVEFGEPLVVVETK